MFGGLLKIQVKEWSENCIELAASSHVSTPVEIIVHIGIVINLQRSSIGSF